MKDKIVSSLKSIASGSIKSGGSIAIAIVMAILVICAVAAIPALLIWGLQLMGLDIEVTWKTYAGSVLILVYLGFAKSGSGKSKE